MKFDQGMHLDDPKVDLEGQGHKVARSKNVIVTLVVLRIMLEAKGHMSQGQILYWSRSQVTGVKVSLKVMILAGVPTSMSSCFILNEEIDC